MNIYYIFNIIDELCKIDLIMLKISLKIFKMKTYTFIGGGFEVKIPKVFGDML